MLRASRMASALRSGALHSVLDSRHAPCGRGRLQRSRASVSEPSRSSNVARLPHGINSIGVRWQNGPPAPNEKHGANPPTHSPPSPLLPYISPHALTPFATASLHHA
eukprot:794182-Prymnesium_polylepis.1